MKFTIAFSLKTTCVRCGQTLSEKELASDNCELTWPDGTFQHKTCPVVKADPAPECHFAYLPDKFHQKPNN